MGASGLSGARGLTEPDATQLLTHGTIDIEGRLADASNLTLRAAVAHGGVVARCVYKPVSGERHLWDFPDGTLAGRECAAYLVSQAAGWAVVPPTVLRDGPFGPGMCQLWIDEERHCDVPVLGLVPAQRVPAGWRRVAAARDEQGRSYALAHADDPRLARLAAFDVVVNNADRKGGHVIATVDGRLYGIDHGVCFNVEDKLRTVLWGWAGEPLPAVVVTDLERLRGALSGELRAALAAHLAPAEIRAAAQRVEDLLDTRRYPQPGDDWPALPWPPI